MTKQNKIQSKFSIIFTISLKSITLEPHEVHPCLQFISIQPESDSFTHTNVGRLILNYHLYKMSLDFFNLMSEASYPVYTLINIWVMKKIFPAQKAEEEPIVNVEL